MRGGDVRWRVGAIKHPGKSTLLPPRIEAQDE
jgi:hypothetical protein